MPVARLGLAQRPPHGGLVEGGRRGGRRGRAPAHERGGGLLAGEAVERREEIGLRALEEPPGRQAVAHAPRRVEDERDGGRAARHGRARLLRTLQPRPGQRGRHRGDEERARREEEELLQAQPPLGLAPRAQDEVDGRERRGLGAAPEEEVDDERHRRREEAPQERRMEEGEAHRL